MSVIFVLLAASLTIATGFLIAFIWSVKTGQYDDDYTPSVRMLFDDVQPEKDKNTGNSRARDVEGLAPASAACLLRHAEAGAKAKPVAARPGAQIKSINDIK